MTSDVARKTFADIRNSTDRIDPAELDALWPALETVRSEDILGTWKGELLDTGHANAAGLDGISWYGKRLRSLTDAQPLVCVGEDGELYSNTEIGGGGEASLWMVEFRGEVTATLVYDALPIFDHFKRVDDTTLLGVMNGKPDVVLDNGQFLYFVLDKA